MRNFAVALAMSIAHVFVDEDIVKLTTVSSLKLTAQELSSSPNDYYNEDNDEVSFDTWYINRQVEILDVKRSALGLESYDAPTTTASHAWVLFEGILLPMVLGVLCASTLVVVVVILIRYRIENDNQYQLQDESDDEDDVEEYDLQGNNRDNCASVNYYYPSSSSYPSGSGSVKYVPYSSYNFGNQRQQLQLDYDAVTYAPSDRTTHEIEQLVTGTASGDGFTVTFSVPSYIEPMHTRDTRETGVRDTRETGVRDTRQTLVTPALGDRNTAVTRDTRRRTSLVGKVLFSDRYTQAQLDNIYNNYKINVTEC